MRSSSLLLLVALVLSCVAHADETIVVERGQAALTLSDIDARMSRFPDHERARYSRDPENIARMLDQMLVNRELARQAAELGLDEDPIVKRDLQLAAEEVLAIHRLNRLITLDTLPDFEQLAHEQFLASPELRQIPESRQVQHILVSTTDRTDEEALARAEEIRALALAPGADFSSLVETYSDDPGKSANLGRYTVSVPGEYVPAFETASRELAAAGDVSEPVKSNFGYHIITLNSVTPAVDKSFDEVKLGLIRKLRDDYIRDTRGRFVADIKGVEDTGDMDLLRSLPARYGGRPEEAAAE